MISVTRLSLLMMQLRLHVPCTNTVRIQKTLMIQSLIWIITLDSVTILKMTMKNSVWPVSLL